MAVSGIKLELTNEDIVYALRESKGVVVKAARNLNVCKHTIYNKLNEDIELKNELFRIRQNLSNDILDMSIEKVEEILSGVDNLQLEAAIAKFIIEKKGYERGFGKAPDEQRTEEGAVNQMTAILKQITRMQREYKEDNGTSTIQPETD